MVEDANPLDPELAGTIRTLSALAQATRLRVYLDLLAALPGGRPSGEIAVRTGTPATTMSVHLAILTRAGLVSAERRGRSIVYTAQVEATREMTAMLSAAIGG